MIYFYIVKIRYFKGNQCIDKTYYLNFHEIVDFFVELNKKHNDNFLLLSIKEKKY